MAAIKLKEDMVETLLNSPNPLRLFAIAWHMAIEVPRRTARQKIQQELLNRDLKIVTALMQRFRDVCKIHNNFPRLAKTGRVNCNAISADSGAKLRIKSGCAAYAYDA